MAEQLLIPLQDLYEEDETAWFEASAQLIAQGKTHDLDWQHLQEHLSDMARREKREVYSRLVVLLAHLLKWEHQSEKRTNSWKATIVEQRRELRELVQSKTLRNHAEAELARAYRDAVEEAAAATGLGEATFATECPMSLDEILS